jgi:hypothetical protein
MKLVSGKTVVSAENAKFKVTALRLSSDAKRMMAVHQSVPASRQAESKPTRR